ncbi:PAS sensor protein, partial [[Kitasatospora] papulosa]
MNFTRWSARFPGTQRRAAARDDHSSVPAARAESVRPRTAAGAADDTSEDSAQGPSPEALSAGELLGRLPAPVALLHGPEHRITYVNAAYTSAFGPRPSGV